MGALHYLEIMITDYTVHQLDKTLFLLTNEALQERKEQLQKELDRLAHENMQPKDKRFDSSQDLLVKYEYVKHILSRIGVIENMKKHQ